MQIRPLIMLVLAAITLLLCSCISQYQIRKLGDKPFTGLNPEYINGIYANHSGNENDAYTLWEKLRRCASNKGDTLRLPQDATVKLEFDGNRKINATLLKDTVPLRQITLKVHYDDSCLWTKRKLFLIPVPLLFYVYNEDRALLFNASEQELCLNYKARAFAMTLGAAGSSKIEESRRYRKLKEIK